MSDIRINARLDEQTASDLEFLRKALGDTSTTEVLKYSLQQTAENLRDRDQARKQKNIWKSSGLIGCIKDAPKDLSTNYKESIGDYLAEKYPRQVNEK